MDPATLKMALHIAASFVKSKTGRRIVVAVGVIWALMVSVAVFLPIYLMQMVAPAMHQVHSCTEEVAVTGGDGAVPLPNTDPSAVLEVKIASWNVYRYSSNAKIIAGIKALGAAGADVIGLNEMAPESRRRAVRRGLGPEWGFSTGNNAVPIVWRRDRLDVVAQDSREIFGVRRIEAGVSGRSIGPKSYQWIQFKSRATGAVGAVVNHHLVPTIETRGRPDPTNPVRVKLAVAQLRAAAAASDRFRAAKVPVALTGDHNIAAAADAKVKDPRWPYVFYAQHGLYSNWRTLGYPSTGTLGNRLIDYVFATTALAAPVKQQILGSRGFSGSDHRAVLVDLSNKAQRSQLQRRRTSPQLEPRLNIDLTRPAPGTAPRPAPRAAGTEREQQIANARLIEQGVRKAGGSGRAVYVALVAAVGESDLINIDYGDRAGPDSRGLFQQREPWGSLAQRMDPVWAAGAFLLGPRQARSGGLLDLAGWDTLPVTTAIHRVQINSDPTHYVKFEGRARQIGNEAGVDFDAADGTGASRSSTRTGDLPSIPGLDAAQAKVAAQVVATTAAVGKELGWSAPDIEQASIVALAVGQTETTMGQNRATTGPDRGIFGQRILPGWYGTEDQVNDPAYATRAFLIGVPSASAGITGLKDVNGWQNLPPHHAAQRVQRSGAGDGNGEAYGSNYEKWVPLARTAYAKLAGVAAAGAGTDPTSTAPDLCADPAAPAITGAAPSCAPTNNQFEKILTPDALRVLRCVASKWPQITDIGTYQGHDPDITRAVDVMIPDWQSATGRALGQTITDWAKANHKALGVQYIVWRGQIWNIQRDTEGWRRHHGAGSSDPGDAHTNHVHIAVYGDRGTGFANTDTNRNASLGMIGTGPCPLDKMYTGDKPGRDCNQALAFMRAQMQSPTQNWYRRCLNSVATAYDFAGGATTAYAAALRVQAAGKISTDRTNIPRGAVMWWDGTATGNASGHVAIYDGEGQIYSTDATGRGKIGRVPWEFPVTNWGQKWMGWSPPGTWGPPE